MLPTKIELLSPINPKNCFVGLFESIALFSSSHRARLVDISMWDPLYWCYSAGFANKHQIKWMRWFIYNKNTCRKPSNQIPFD